MFWECSADVHNDVAFSMMSKNRSDEIMKYFHLAVNISLTNERFSEVQYLLNKLKEQCLSKYLPEQTVSNEKSIVPYFGRHGCKQFMNKLVKFGYKLRVAATPI